MSDALALPQLDDAASHRDVVVRIVRHFGFRIGAELGLARGLLFRRLLAECPGLEMIGVDLFKREHRRAAVDAIAAEYAGRCTVLACSTIEGAKRIATRSLDFVFVDAGHGYCAVTDDLAAWRDKVRAGGMMMGHDYDAARHPGVVRAVDEMFGGGVVSLPHTVWCSAR